MTCDMCEIAANDETSGAFSTQCVQCWVRYIENQVPFVKAEQFILLKVGVHHKEVNTGELLAAWRKHIGLGD